MLKFTDNWMCVFCFDQVMKSHDQSARDLQYFLFIYVSTTDYLGLPV